MPNFRKKPVVIEAIQYRGDSNFNSIRLFLGNDEPIHRLGGPIIGIHTLEGVMEARPGDWIIKGVKGEPYPCKPDIFEATYEQMPPAPHASTLAKAKGIAARAWCDKDLSAYSMDVKRCEQIALILAEMMDECCVGGGS